MGQIGFAAEKSTHRLKLRYHLAKVDAIHPSSIPPFRIWEAPAPWLDGFLRARPPCQPGMPTTKGRLYLWPSGHRIYFWAFGLLFAGILWISGHKLAAPTALAWMVFAIPLIAYVILRRPIFAAQDTQTFRPHTPNLYDFASRRYKKPITLWLGASWECLPHFLREQTDPLSWCPDRGHALVLRVAVQDFFFTTRGRSDPLCEPTIANSLRFFWSPVWGAFVFLLALILFDVYEKGEKPAALAMGIIWAVVTSWFVWRETCRLERAMTAPIEYRSVPANLPREHAPATPTSGLTANSGILQAIAIVIAALFTVYAGIVGIVIP